MKKSKAPNHLTDEAKGLWQRLTDEYGIADSAGLAILKAGCEAWDRAKKAREAIDAQGMVIFDKFQQMKPHPLLAVERDSRAAFLAAMKHLNFDIEPLRDGPGRPPGGMKC
jgi:P27 family predicted phage terminase small subunit